VIAGLGADGDRISVGDLCTEDRHIGGVDAAIDQPPLTISIPINRARYSWPGLIVAQALQGFVIAAGIKWLWATDQAGIGGR
jgi:hypothetical protein